MKDVRVSINCSGLQVEQESFIKEITSALEKYDLNRGMAALCIGGGEATAMAIERLR